MTYTVYCYSDMEGRILYVGRTRKLHFRIRQHGGRFGDEVCVTVMAELERPEQAQTSMNKRTRRSDRWMYVLAIATVVISWVLPFTGFQYARSADDVTMAAFILLVLWMHFGRAAAYFEARTIRPHYKLRYRQLTGATTPTWTR